MESSSPLSRRAFGWKLLLALALVRTRAWAAGSGLVPTPRTGRGPFFPAGEVDSAGSDLLRAPQAVGGELLDIIGRVRGQDGQAVAGATLVIWQTDAHGQYDHPDSDPRPSGADALDPAFRYWGTAKADADGHYRFSTIVPGRYAVGGRWRPKHVHFEVRAEGYSSLATEMHFAGDPHAKEDFVATYAQHLMLAVEPRAVEPGPGDRPRQEASFDIVLTLA